MNKALLLLLTLFYITFAQNDITRLLNRTRYDSRIINGREVSPEFHYPWMISIKKRGGSICGGALISETVMITAGHCSKSGKNREFTILAHRHDLRKSNQDENGYGLKVKKRVIHPEHDIAIWFLEASDFQLSKKLHFAPLDTGLIMGEKTHKIVTALGWGWVKTGGPGSNVLMEVEVPLVEPYKCQSLWHRRGVDVNPDTQVCAGWPEGRKDTCKGDSGGPLFYELDGVSYLVGLTSFGEPCAKANTPTVYVRASRFEPWIQEQISKEVNNNTTIEIENENQPKMIDNILFKKNESLPIHLKLDENISKTNNELNAIQTPDFTKMKVVVN